ncbi:hypothetical protein HPG69_019266 [Diceros bicornis minor]|uniref:Coiled-coil domain-containing protein 60 n=1 Tax=Diceros bicornis minor TaxID=77932 RepID=A0A7J7FMG4_DICBM|nr:hypothetical protein HPG69_019266 [Diceros bicornis minor]
MKKKQQQLQKLKEEERHKFQPAKKISEIQYGDILLTTYDDEKTKKVGTGVILRPFTPVRSCIISPSLPEAHVLFHCTLDEQSFEGTPLPPALCPPLAPGGPDYRPHPPHHEACDHLLESKEKRGLLLNFKKKAGGAAWAVLAKEKSEKPCGLERKAPKRNAKSSSWDPGGSKNTIKKINKDKSMGQKWEHFVTAPKTKKFKIPALRVTARKTSRRGSALSLSRASGGSSPQSSMMSVIPGSDEPQSVITQATGSKDIEDNESSSTKPDEEPLHINLQKLLEMVREDARRTITIENEMQKKVPSILSMLRQNKSDSAYKDMQTTLKSSERSSSTSAESHIPKKSKSHTSRDIIHCKSGVCNIMRAKFYGVAQEAGFCLQDKMEILMKRQEERGLQKFHSFVLVSNFQKDMAKMRHQVPMVKGDAEEIADHWYFDLLSKLPEDLKNFRPAKKILAKLQKFGENLDLRIRPHVLLRVLQDLRIWELCSPDIAVAIEFVREHIIHMPQEDYINWLQNRINIPIRPHSAQT